MAKKPVNRPVHLRSVETSVQPEILTKALRPITVARLINADKAAYRRILPDSFSMSRSLGMPLRLDDLSPQLGMGVEFDTRERVKVVHIDGQFLTRALEEQVMKRRTITAEHFVVSALAFQYVKDLPAVQVQRMVDRHVSGLSAWGVASRHAAHILKLDRNQERNVIMAYRPAIIDMNTESVGFMMRIIDAENDFGVKAPSYPKVPAWTGIAYPKDPEELQPLHGEQL